MEQKELFNKYSNIIQESVSSKKENHYLIWLDDYIKLEKENEQLRMILGNQVRIKDDLLERINKAIEYIEKHSFFVEDTGYEKIIGYPKESYNAQDILEILNGGGVDE